MHRRHDLDLLLRIVETKLQSIQRILDAVQKSSFVDLRCIKFASNTCLMRAASLTSRSNSAILQSEER